MPQFPAVIELSSLNGRNGFTITGEAAYNESGLWVASGGDVNGDGFADLLVTAYGGGGYFGTTYIVFGKAGSFGSSFSLSTIDGENGFRLYGAGFDRTGDSSVVLGDFNGDGFDDVLVGARGSEPQDSGGAYLVYGKAGGFDASLVLTSQLDGNNGFKLAGVHTYDQAGYSVSGAGDVNGDGFDDLIIGASGADPNGYDSGTTYVVFGTSAAFDATFDLADIDGTNGFSIQGEAEGDRSGSAVALVGDLNGDGFSDLIIGAKGADPNGDGSGASYVVFGAAAGFGAALDLSDLDGSNGFKLGGVAAYDYSGFSVASAGDVNGDGFADLIVGAFGADPNGSRSGASYVVFGEVGGFDANVDLSGLDGNNGFKLNGAAANNFSGFSVASAGDVNGDGFDDVIVGAFGASPHGGNSGAAYVVFGKASGFDAALQLSGLDGNNGFKLSGVAFGDYTGRSVSSAGDVNGDGFADLLVGAFYADPNGHNHSGSTYVVFGIAPDEAVHRVGTVASQTLAGGKFDDTLEGLGGHDRLFGNAGHDTLKGGAGQDVLNGGKGADALKGGIGADVYAYTKVADSTGANYDTITGFNFAGVDRFDLKSNVKGVDADISSGALSDATFDTDLAVAVDSAHLGRHHAVLFTPDSGTLAGEVFLVIDTNKVAGYQAGEDLVIHLDRPAHLTDIDLTDFI